MIQAVCEWFSTAGAVERVGWVLVHSLWQFAVVAAVAAAVTAVLHGLGPVVRHTVLASGLVAMAVLPVVTLWAVDVTPARSGFTASATASSVSQWPSVSPAPTAVSRGAVVVPIRVVIDGGASAAGGRGFDVEAVRRALAPWLGWCVAAWLVGVGCCAVRPLVGWAAWRRLRARGVAVPAEVGRMVDRACRRLGVARGVRALATGGIDVPAVAGWLSPVVLVPMALVTSLPAFATAGLAGLVVAVSLAARVQADDLPTDTNTITSLTPEEAKTLVNTVGRGREVEWQVTESMSLRCSGLPLQGLTTLDPKTAKELARFQGHAILLTGLRDLDIDTAKSFAAFDGQVVVQEELRKTFVAKYPLSPETALAWAGVARDELSAVTVLDAATVQALTCQAIPCFKDRGLELSGLTTLDADTAKALAGFKCDDLSFQGLTTLSPEAATALAGFKGQQLYLGRLTTLSPEAATALAASKSWNGWLYFITAFDSPDSVAVAEALAKRAGPLKLPNLMKISPKTLAALLEKEDVEIPLIEKLELIPEPDGSPTDDFLIPRGFKERQLLQKRMR